MKSWEAEFGYELIDADLTLQYPPVDTALVTLMQRAVEQARVRRKYLQSIAPARFGRAQSVLRPSSRGGFERVGGGTSSGGGDSMAAGSNQPESTWPGRSATTDEWTTTPSSGTPSGGAAGTAANQRRSGRAAIEGQDKPVGSLPGNGDRSDNSSPHSTPPFAPEPGRLCCESPAVRGGATLGRQHVARSTNVEIRHRRPRRADGSGKLRRNGPGSRWAQSRHSPLLEWPVFPPCGVRTGRCPRTR